MHVSCPIHLNGWLCHQCQMFLYFAFSLGNPWGTLCVYIESHKRAFPFLSKKNPPWGTLSLRNLVPCTYSAEFHHPSGLRCLWSIWFINVNSCSISLPFSGISRTVYVDPTKVFPFQRRFKVELLRKKETINQLSKEPMNNLSSLVESFLEAKYPQYPKKPLKNHFFLKVYLLCSIEFHSPKG